MNRILIVDDDPDFVNATRMVLEKEGYQVEEASGGKEGYQQARSSQPDLIILDVMMDSVLDGVSMSRKLHEDSLTKTIPVVMVTSIANTDYAALFPTDEYIHIKAFMSKPIEPGKLSQKINKILS